MEWGRVVCEDHIQRLNEAARSPGIRDWNAVIPMEGLPHQITNSQYRGEVLWYESGKTPPFHQDPAEKLGRPYQDPALTALLNVI